MTTSSRFCFKAASSPHSFGLGAFQEGGLVSPGRFTAWHVVDRNYPLLVWLTMCRRPRGAGTSKRCVPGAED
jgi:hypothetical protein